jgi:hypothetical protein
MSHLLRFSSGYLTILLFNLMVSIVQAQPHFHAAWNFSTALPQGDFKSNIDDSPVGWGLEIGYLINNSPFSIGGSFGYQRYSVEKFQVIYPSYTLEQESKNSILQWHFLLRMQPKSGRVRPYLDGLIGFNYLSSQTIFRDHYTGYKIAQSTDFDDLVHSYGGGGGIMFQLYDGQLSQGGSKEGVHGILMDLKIHYLIGGKADYLKEASSLSITNLINTDEIFHSDTDVLTVSFGLVIAF